MYKNVESLSNVIGKGDTRFVKNVMFIYYTVIMYKNRIMLQAIVISFCNNGLFISSYNTVYIWHNLDKNF